MPKRFSTYGDFKARFPKSMYHFVFDVFFDDCCDPPEYKPFLAERGSKTVIHPDASIENCILGVNVPPSRMPKHWYKVEIDSTGKAPAAWWKFARRHASGPIVINYPHLETLYFMTEVEAIAFAVALPMFKYEDFGD